jgi:hypothetical protein
MSYCVEMTDKMKKVPSLFQDVLFLAARIYPKHLSVSWYMRFVITEKTNNLLQ